MSDSIDNLIERINQGDPVAAQELFPIIYDDLKGLAKNKLRGKAQKEMQPTSLVHEAYVKLGKSTKLWDKQHLFATAAEAMRCVLVDKARRRAAKKRGGDCKQIDLDVAEISITEPGEQVIHVSEALEKLERDYPKHAQVVKLRYFGGLNVEQIAELIGVSRSTIDRRWMFAKANLLVQLKNDQPPPPASAAPV